MTAEVDGVERRVVAIIQKRLASLGLAALERPLGEGGEPLEPRLPYDLTMINDVMLGRLYGQFCLMGQFAQYHLALASVKASVYRQTEKLIRAEEWIKQNGTVKDKEATNESAPRVKKINFDALIEEGTEKLSKALLESYMIGRDACSRELSRRQITTERR